MPIEARQRWRITLRINATTAILVRLDSHQLISISILFRSCFDPVSILQCALLSYGIDCTVPELEEVYVQHPIHAAVPASHVPSLGDCNVPKAPLSLASSRRTVMVTPPSDSDPSLRANGSASRGIFDW